MNLAFLTPDAASSRAVCARSPMERLAVAAGARLSRVEGWNVPNAYSAPSTEWGRLTRTVGFVDRSSLAKLELQAEPRELARIVAQASDGLALEPGLAGRSPIGRSTGTWWCPVTPGRVLVLSEPGAAAAVRATATRAAEDARGTVSVLDVTCGLAALSLIGPGARELLARFCAIDVRPALAPPGAFRPGSVARTPGCLLVEAEDRLLVLVGWALGEYLWRVVADAAADLGGGPVGAEALAQHLERDDA
ncbi:MAG: sarcosine oxidase subunit gamma family protein [Solirubrobacteraceae bacterium]